MRKDIAVKWVEALRSGKYNQAPYSLKTDEGYCCLGVLCETTTEHHNWRFHENKLRDSHDLHDFAMEILPESLRESFGITSNEQDDFTTMNDDMGMSFVQIADYIQAKFIDETFEGNPDMWYEQQVGRYAPDSDEVPTPT